MRFTWLWPAFVVIPVLIGGLAVCFLGWRRSRAQGRSAIVAWARRTLMVVAVALCGAAPGVAVLPTTGVAPVEVYFVVDRTGSMAAEDYNGSEQRMNGVKSDLLELLEAYPNARYSIIAFDSSATTQLPVTTDTNAVRSWVDVYEREVTESSHGSNMNRPVERLDEALTRSQEKNPDHVRLVYLFSDGETRDDSANAQLDYSGLADKIDGGAVFGYGTPEGGQMKEMKYDGTEGNYIEDPDSNETALSRIDEEALQTISSQLGVNYEHRTAPGGVESLTEDTTGLVAEAQARQESSIYSPRIWPFGLLLAVLAVWEIAALVPQVRNMRELTGIERRRAGGTIGGSGGPGGVTSVVGGAALGASGGQISGHQSTAKMMQEVRR